MANKIRRVDICILFLFSFDLTCHHFFLFSFFQSFRLFFSLNLTQQFYCFDVSAIFLMNLTPNFSNVLFFLLFPIFRRVSVNVCQVLWLSTTGFAHTCHNIVNTIQVTIRSWWKDTWATENACNGLQTPVVPGKAETSQFPRPLFWITWIWGRTCTFVACETVHFRRRRKTWYWLIG